MEELVKKLYTELYLSVDEIARMLTHHRVYSLLWRFGIIRSQQKAGQSENSLDNSQKNKKQSIFVRQKNLA
jgi:hypothetical protein